MDKLIGKDTAELTQFVLRRLFDNPEGLASWEVHPESAADGPQSARLIRLLVMLTHTMQIRSQVVERDVVWRLFDTGNTRLVSPRITVYKLEPDTWLRVAKEEQDGRN